MILDSLVHGPGVLTMPDEYRTGSLAGVFYVTDEVYFVIDHDSQLFQRTLYDRVSV